MKEYMEQIMYSHKWFKILSKKIEKKVKRLRMKISKWIDIIQKQITDNEETFKAKSIKMFWIMKEKLYYKRGDSQKVSWNLLRVQ